ncbi:glycoside hydrolase family 30 protein [Edaphobacter modestus]|uniref:Glucosylceramidase n=1 Tax=Edaphobacter modestus TaxID=388466 RepID=A0A4Q7YTW0_9BACT|nr:glycoside hydrolase family 30 beta sandwich domain-containing protein [Edaphobacter modestus]RZU41028.1 glucosylceramidase [Edaphobacter modestus]
MTQRRSWMFLALAVALAPIPVRAQDASLWLTKPDRSALLQLQTPPLAFAGGDAAGQVIDVDEKQRYQTIDGFGFALTGGSAQLIAHMSAEARAALVKDLFSTEGDGIGVSYLRVSVGASDMNDHVYSYDDLPEGQTDVTMEKFSIEPDRADVIPVLKQILAINSKIKILASPWSAPLWMKTSGVARGGVLKPEYFAAYATYFVKYIQAMKAEGIDIDTLTVQNEPLNEKNTPSMLMLESEQADFIENDLGPAFQKAGIKTKIVLYDHNLDHPAYPLSILKDPKANKYVDGTGFHLYGGTVDAFTQVHDAFPKKNLYFTEQSVTDHRNEGEMDVAKPVAKIVIGTTRNWSRNVLLWNLAADPQFGPHTNDGGCTGCQGALTIDGDKVKRNLAYYTIAQASKFVPDGSVRIGSSNADAIPNVAFRTPDGKTVLIVANSSASDQVFSVRFHGKVIKSSLTAGSVGTYVW